MARPKLGDSETERLHLKITADEVKAIDDWRYANRVPSRSEAVRRLCSVALVALNGLDHLKQMAEDLSVSARDDYEHAGGLLRGLLNDAIEGNQHGFDYDGARDLLIDLSNRAYWQNQHSRYLNRIIAGISDATNMLADPQTFAAAERNAREKLAELDDFVEMQHQDWDVMAESHARSAVIRALTDAERAELDALEDREDRIRYLDQKVSKYVAKQRRRQKRLREKVRKEDERIRQLVLSRRGSEPGSEDPSEEEGK